MQRFFIRAIGITVLALAIAAVAGYFYGRSKLPELISLLASELERRGYSIEYRIAETPSSGLSVTLNDLSVKAENLGYVIRAPEARLGFELRSRWPPLSFSLSLKKLQLQEIRESAAEPSNKVAEPAPKAPSFYVKTSFLSLLLLLCHYELGIEHADLSAIGVSDLTASLWARKFQLNDARSESAVVHYDALVSVFNSSSPPMHLNGLIHFRPPRLELTSGNVEVGPLRLSSTGFYDVDSSDGQLHLFIPSTDLNLGSPFVSGRVTSWLKSIGGHLEVDWLAEKKAGAEDWTAKGNITAQGLRLETKDSPVLGRLEGDLKIEIENYGARTWNLRGDADFDLTKSEIKSENFLHKGVGIPLVVKVEGFTLTGERDAGIKGKITTKKIALSFSDRTDPGLQSLEGTFHWPTHGPLTADKISAHAWNGLVSASGDCSKLNLTLERVDANRFLSTFSPQGKDILGGQLYSQGGLDLSEENKPKGSGKFRVTEGELMTLKFGKPITDALRQIPGLSKYVKLPTTEEKFREISGAVDYQGNQIRLRGVQFLGQHFDIRSAATQIDDQMNLKGNANFYPKESMVPQKNLEALKDETGQPAIPLILSGPMKMPRVEVDLNLVTQRLTSFFEKRIKKKIPEELQNQIKDGLRRIFK